jgi:hypothetical protein
MRHGRNGWSGMRHGRNGRRRRRYGPLGVRKRRLSRCRGRAVRQGHDGRRGARHERLGGRRGARHGRRRRYGRSSLRRRRLSRCYGSAGRHGRKPRLGVRRERRGRRRGPSSVRRGGLRPGRGQLRRRPGVRVRAQGRRDDQRACPIPQVGRRRSDRLLREGGDSHGACTGRGRRGLVRAAGKMSDRRHCQGNGRGCQLGGSRCGRCRRLGRRGGCGRAMDELAEIGIPVGNPPARPERQDQPDPDDREERVRFFGRFIVRPVGKARAAILADTLPPDEFGQPSFARGMRPLVDPQPSTPRPKGLASFLASHLGGRQSIHICRTSSIFGCQGIVIG